MYLPLSYLQPFGRFHVFKDSLIRQGRQISVTAITVCAFRAREDSPNVCLQRSCEQYFGLGTI